MRTRDDQIADVFPGFYAEDAESTVTKGDLRLMLEQAEHRAEQRVRAEIGRDSDRLDWLDSQFRSCTVYMNGEQIFMPGPKARNLKGRDFREAIDAAREVW